VGVEGYAIAERAYQRARSYATERVQGRAVGDPSGKRVTIIDHPDVARMMIDMKSRVEAMRAVSLYAAQAMDCSIRQPDERAKAKAQQRLDVLIPVVKGWSSE
ncbi:MAG: acyl-CoA dehydrogenase family protein, partial [Pseudomonadota bacterium]